MSRNVRDKMHGEWNCINIFHQIQIFNVNKCLPPVLLTSKTLYCHQYSADFTCLISLARVLFLYSWLTLNENGGKRDDGKAKRIAES